MLGDADVYRVTAKGNAELKAAGTSLSAAELDLLVLIDGSATVAQVAHSAPHLPKAELIEILGRLLARQLIAPAAAAGAAGDGLETGFFNVPPDFLKSLAEAPPPEVDKGVLTLKQKGYFVRIARRRTEKREAKEGWRPTILLIDDDPDILKLVRTFFKMEGFDTREARSKAEIMTGFRQPPMPDLVLLDIELPDANGFDVLARMREHPVLKSMPVIVLTAAATREAVLRGLRAGADGYITKPFEPDQLITAVKQVLGLPA